MRAVGLWMLGCWNGDVVVCPCFDAEGIARDAIGGSLLTVAVKSQLKIFLCRSTRARCAPFGLMSSIVSRQGWALSIGI